MSLSSPLIKKTENTTIANGNSSITTPTCQLNASTDEGSIAKTIATNIPQFTYTGW